MLGGAWKAGRFAGEVFALQPDGTVRCPAGKALFPCERRREQEGSLRIVFAARIADCRACPKREPCQWHGHQTTKPRQMSVLLHPLKVGPAPLVWRDWPRREHRRACMQLARRQRVDLTLPLAPPPEPPRPPVQLSRAQRAHDRLSWAECLARHARSTTEVSPTITVFGVPDLFAAFLGLKAA